MSDKLLTRRHALGVVAGLFSATMLGCRDKGGPKPEGDEDPLGAFHRVQGDVLRQLQLDIGVRWPQANRFKFVTGQGDGHKFMWRAPVPDEAPGELTPVMARLGPADLETLDTLITAGFAANRAQAVRWALARIRERPAYAELRERAREIENLRSRF